MTDGEFWEREAQQQAKNVAFYRDLVIRAGKAIGKAAYTCDNGDVSQDVLCAKVPELVEAMVSTKTVDPSYESTMGERYAKELDDLGELLQRRHPIGEVKAIGRLEVFAAVVSLPPALEWMVPPWRSVRADPQEPETGCWPYVGDPFLAAVKVRKNGSSERCRADLDKAAWYWEYTILAWSETGLEMDGESWDAWGESDIDFIARIPEPSAIDAMAEIG